MKVTRGGDITTAAIAHQAHSSPEELRFTGTDFNSYVTVSTVSGAHIASTDRCPPAGPRDLGVEPRMSVFGNPVVEIA